MADLKQSLQQAQSIANSPKQQLDAFLAQGKKVVGCLPMHTPEILVHAAGMVPIGLWGAQVEQSMVKTYLPAFACPIMQSCLELGLRGDYKGLSAVLIPTMCDVFRCVTQDWKSGVDIPMIPITYPQNRGNEASIPFLVSELQLVQAKLEAFSGAPITDAAIEASFEVYNRHNALMREFAQLANQHLDIITPEVRHAVMKSALFTERAQHSRLMEDINAGLKAAPVCEWKGKRVVLTGITAEPDAFLAALSGNGIAVVGDDLGQEMRQYRTDVPAGGPPLERLARQWQNRRGDALAYEPSKARGELLLELVENGKADGVIVCLMKFCDPEEYDFPIYHKQLMAAGVPTLSLDIDQQPNNYEQAKNRVQAFAEMI